MAKKADVGKGDTIEWSWGAGKGRATVTKVHTEDVERTIKGATVKREASKAKPAVEAKMKKGAKVLKSTSEVRVK